MFSRCEETSADRVCFRFSGTRRRLPVTPILFGHKIVTIERSGGL